MLRIVPYSKVSMSARLLATTLSRLLGYKVLRGPPDPRAVNLAWGGTTHGLTKHQTAHAIQTAVNKLHCFRAMEKGGVSIPSFSTSRDTARKWKLICVRQLLSSSEGRGLTVVENSQEIPDAPLYVEYIPKRKEFRVHVFNGKVIDVQEKRKRRDSDADTQIRNHENGWVFCHENIQEPGDLREQAILAVKSCGLLFGAVDIVWNESRNKSYVLEINTSPGLAPSTAAKYAEGIRQWLIKT